MNEVEIPIIYEDAETVPHYASDEAAGCDVRAAIEESQFLAPGEWRLIPTGIKLQIPEGYEVQIRPRSGLANRFGITLLNSPATIDSDYRGEIQVMLINLGKSQVEITRHMRIAQLIIAPVCRAKFTRIAELSTTKRGVNGFGHTGTH